MALLQLQYSYQAECLSQLRPHNTPVWFRMLALNGEGFIKTLYISHQEPSAYPTHLLATILMRRRWRWIGHVTRKLLCIGRQKENAKGAAPRSHGGGRWRKKSRRWGRPGKASSLWQGTDRCGRNILLPYMPFRRHEWVSDVTEGS